MGAMGYVMHEANRARLSRTAHEVYVAAVGIGDWGTKVGVSSCSESRCSGRWRLKKVYRIGPSAIDAEQQIHALLEDFGSGFATGEIYDLHFSDVIVIADMVIRDMRRAKLIKEVRPASRRSLAA